MTDPGRELELAKERRASVDRLIHTYEKQLARVMPRHVNQDAFLGLALAYVRRDPKVLDAAFRNPQSLVLALRECAALGHMPQKGIFALVPFNNRSAVGGIEVVGVEEYRGVIERMYRAGGITSVHVELVRVNDTNEAGTGPARWRPARMVLPDHEFDEYADEETRGDITAVYAYARMKGGGISQVVWMNAAEVRKHEKDTPFWKGRWRPDMVRKTALHKLERYVPTSNEYRDQLSQSFSAAVQMTGVPDDAPVRRFPEADDPDAVVEGETVDGPPSENATRVTATTGMGSRPENTPQPRPGQTDGPDWSDVKTARPPQ